MKKYKYLIYFSINHFHTNVDMDHFELILFHFLVTPTILQHDVSILLMRIKHTKNKCPHSRKMSSTRQIIMTFHSNLSMSN